MAGGQNLLSRETRNLVTALRRPDVRGQWGEITLRRLVELSGMTLHVDFTEQQHRSTDSGAIRPDMVVHMPDRRDIVVDVKTPLEAYLSAVEAQNDEDRALQLRRHAQIVGARVRELSSKQYWSQFERSPDFVVLFLPGDQFLIGGAAGEPGLDRRVAASERDAGHAHQPGGAAENRLPMAGSNRCSPTMPPRFAAWARSCTSAWRYSANISASSANPSAAASIPSTRPSDRSNSKCCPPHADFPSSDCA